MITNKIKKIKLIFYIFFAIFLSASAISLHFELQEFETFSSVHLTDEQGGGVTISGGSESQLKFCNEAEKCFNLVKRLNSAFDNIFLFEVVVILFTIMMIITELKSNPRQNITTDEKEV